MACAGCGNKLGDRFFKLDSRYFHHDCFVCKTCGVTLSSGYYEQNGEIYCQAHIPHTYGTAPRATVGGKGSAYLDPDESTESRKCQVCYGYIKTDPYVVVEEEVVHKKCFMCTGCGKPFGKNPYFYHGPGIYLCEKDNTWAKGQDDRDWTCWTCKKSIKDSVMIVRGNKFHPECVKCSFKGCKEPGKFISLDDNYCATHMPEGSDVSTRIDRKSTVSAPRDDSESSPGRVSRAFAKMDVAVKIAPRQPKMEYSQEPKREVPKPINPFASRDGVIPQMEELAPIPKYVSTRPQAFQGSRKAGAPRQAERSDEPEPEREPELPAKRSQKGGGGRGGGGGGGDDEDSDNDTTNDDPEAPTRVSKKNVEKLKKQNEEKKKIEKPKEDTSKLFVEDDDEEEKEAQKRGTPAAARKQIRELEDAKEKLKARMKDEPKAKGKPTYTIPANPDGTPKDAQDLLEARQKEAAKKARRMKEKGKLSEKAERKAAWKKKKAEEAARKEKLTGSGAKLKKKKDEQKKTFFSRRKFYVFKSI